jgi:hypothetical protein
MTDTQTTRNRHPGRWPKGVSGNPAGEMSRAAKEARLDAIVAEWTRPYGGASNLPPCNVVLLKHAADLSLRRPRRADDQVRLANTVSRLVAQAGLASCPSEQTLRRMRAARDKFEAEARQQAQQRLGLPPNFKVDPITGRFVIK